MEDRIRTIVANALAQMGAPGAVFAVERPGDMKHGDYATSAALAVSKQLGKSPKEIAVALIPLLEDALGDDAESVTVAGPGFVNIMLSRQAIARVVKEATQEDWGRGTANTGKRIMVEYTDPNPFKEMHIGHLMSNVIGESVARLTEFSGAQVMRANFQGDVGPHVAKALWALHKKGISDPGTAKEIGDAYTHGSRAYEESPEAKVEIDAINIALYEKNDEALMELWRKGRDVSLAAFEDLYRILGTKFDYYFFESETAGIGLDIVKERTGSVFKESEGAVIYEGEKKGLHTLVFITSRGTPTYETKDIGLAFAKEEAWPSDHSVVLTAAEQIGHFKVFLAALEDIAPSLAGKTLHVPHGFLRLTTGKMSSREGNVITAASLIKDVTEKTLERNDDPLIAGQVALAAIKYSILRQSAGSDIIFDFDTSLSLEGDSGPYLQYAYVRAKKILSYAEGDGGHDEPEEVYPLERLLVHFPEIVARAERERAPHHVAQYLTELASSWNSFYANEQILGSPEERYKQRMARAFANTTKQGLRLLGIPVPERM